jgi:hypothetical protein
LWDVIRKAHRTSVAILKVICSQNEINSFTIAVYSLLIIDSSFKDGLIKKEKYV